MIPDVQSRTSGFKKINLDKVGIENMLIPIKFLKKEKNNYFSTIATFNSYCDLVESVKGINMSRIPRTIIKVLNDYNGVVSWKTMHHFMEELNTNHEIANNIYISASFKLLIPDESPVSHEKTYYPLNVLLEGISESHKEKYYITISASGTSVCPCSKEMSLLINNMTEEQRKEFETLSPEFQSYLSEAGFGAHNQRSLVDLTFQLNPQIEKYFWVEDALKIIQSGFSAPVCSVLKREDEKRVTELGYIGGYIENGKIIKPENEERGAKFVEDIARDISYKLNAALDSNDILDYKIVVKNEESIHPDNLYAVAIKTANRNLK